VSNLGLLISLFSVIALQLLQPSYFANRIEADSEKFIENIMMSDWIECDLKHKKLLMIFTENLKKPLRVHVCGVFVINLQSFLKVIDDY
jgi:hypothetical protein